MTYFLVLLNTLLIEVAMNLPMGSLPLILEHEGSPREHIALTMGAGMLTSVFVSIPIGALVDRIGRITTMKLAVLCAVMTLTGLWLVHGALPGGIFLGLRNIALIAFMTGQAAYISVLVPKDRAVSAVATVGIMGNLAFACAPACAVWLWQHGLGREQYVAANIIMLLAGIFLFFLPAEGPRERAECRPKPTIIRKEWLPAIAFSVSVALQAGVNTALAVLAFHDRGIANGALLFSASALTTVLFRYPAGRVAEVFGPRILAVPTALIQGAACLLAAHATTVPMVIASGVCFGIAWAAVVPVALALYFEDSSADARGAAMGAFFFSFGLGGALGGGLASLTSKFGGGYEQAILICAAIPLVALLGVLRQSRSEAAEPFPADPLPCPAYESEPEPTSVTQTHRS